MTAVRRAVVLSGGYAHPFDDTSALLAGMLRERGGDVTVTENADEALGKLEGDSLLAVNALRWTMVQDEKYAPFRSEYAATLGSDRLAGIERHVARGGALLALHTAVICWDDQPGWRALLGGGWIWGRSHHPPLGDVAVSLAPKGETVLGGPARFTLIDEAYHHLEPAADCTIWAEAAAAGGAPQPVVWTRNHGTGRIAVDALGHDRRSLEAPGHRALLDALLTWLGDDMS